ncbi:MAG: Hpt domain-containing protein [Spirochaetales bacterium]|nr:Hpt domain-containing protein [Spirochaetales bacterium]
MTIEDLERFGANTEEGISRCMGNRDFYLKLVKIMPKDRNFGVLYDAIARNDLDAAFEASHSLKGALGNLSLTPLFTAVQEITELLRARTQTDYSPLVEKIRKLHKELEALCD